MPRAHKLQQGKRVAFALFLICLEIAPLSQLQRQLCSQEFQQSHDLFPGSYSIWWQGAREPGLIIGTGRGERGIWKSSTFPAAGSGTARPQLSPTVGAPRRATKPKARRAKPRDLELLDITIPLFWKDKSQRKSQLTMLPDSYMLWCRREAPRGEQDLPLLQHRLSISTSPTLAAEINGARTKVAQSYVGNLSV